MTSSQDQLLLTEPTALKILVAEDNLVNQKILRHLLQRLGHQVELVTNGLDVLEAVKQQPYEVVLISLEMPDVNGIIVAQRLSQMELEFHRPRLIAMVDDPCDRQSCLAAGLDHCIAKPIQLEELTQALSRAQSQAAADEPDLLQPPLDLEVLRGIKEISGDVNSDIFIEIISAYLDDAPILLQSIRTAITQNSAAELKISAHTLKSISATIGATILAEYCLQLETMGRIGEIDQAGEWLPRLEGELERVQIALQAECQRS